VELQLRYNKDIQLPASAALLHGGNTQAWLKQIGLWGIDARELTCYIIPESISSVKPAGLFVIFNNPVHIKSIDLLLPYGCVGNCLYIPCNAELVPKITAAELDHLLLWDLQIFHPVTGLVGFEKSNQVQIADLIIYPEIKNTDWSFADPGLADKPALSQIIVTPLSVEAVMEEIKTDVGQKPIEDIIPPKERKNPVLGKILTLIKLIIGLPILGLLKLFEFLSKPLAGDHSNNNSGKPGLLRELQTWIEKNLDELQKKRDSELKRLVDLFDKNTNEALQYAIPLNSPYLDRGKQAASSSILGRRLTMFNLRGLGGGTAVDAWDVSNYYNDLRTKYLKAAEKEIGQKDFKKAAYVYAHLLGDYYNAAKVLEQGSFYREAAALHKDHLKNIPAAAQCLERGGLYSEAIDLYKELKEDEKIGDLYMYIKQEDNAQEYYEYCVKRKIEADNLLDAARVVNEKMMQEERAKELLLQGWKSNYQHEPCLKKYFEIIIEKEGADIESTLNNVYKQHTTEKRMLPFLHVLEYVNFKTNSESVLHASQEIAYEVLHKEAIKGNTQNLHNLKKFLPDNKLIGSDTSRFVSNNTGRQEQQDLPAIIQLDNSIIWKKTTWHRYQFIAVGIKNNQLHMARANWYGNTEYYSWETEVKDYANLNFISSPYFSADIILHSSGDIPVARRELPRNKYFSEALVVKCPIWLHKSTAQFLIDHKGNITRLEIDNGGMTLQHYTMEGVLMRSINCIAEAGAVGFSSYYSNPALYVKDEFYYTYTGSRFLVVSATGQVHATELFTGIRMFAALDYSDFFIVISTNKGCSLCKPGKGELNFTGEYFAEKLIPLFIQFIGSHKFVIAEKMKVAVFEITDGKPTLIYELRTNSVIAGILPAAQRNTFAILEEDGKVTVHSIESA
jgi:tetratricopeptide (TPR) repeat protein